MKHVYLLYCFSKPCGEFWGHQDFEVYSSYADADTEKKRLNSLLLMDVEAERRVYWDVMELPVLTTPSGNVPHWCEPDPDADPGE